MGSSGSLSNLFQLTPLASENKPEFKSGSDSKTPNGTCQCLIQPSPRALWAMFLESTPPAQLPGNMPPLPSLSADFQGPSRGI